nr:NAD(P)-dependent oxidoreductase [uncultured Methanoregula sp.]
MKALVTGGSGFLGHYLVKELIKNRIDTVCFDKYPSLQASMVHNSEGKIRVVQGDIRDKQALLSAMEGCEMVFHTAAIADIDQARKLPISTMEVNVVGTATCLECAKELGVKRFMFASTVYTAGSWGSFYRVSKQTGESLCKTFHEEYGLNYTILKYGSLYGKEANHWNFIYRVCKELLTKGEYTYISSPESVREYIHIQDAARETIRIAQNPEFENHIVLISGHQRMKVQEFFGMLQEIIGKKCIIHYTPEEEHRHYIQTPYKFESEIPLRINLSTYVDISEGILDCLNEVHKELQNETGPGKN